MRLLLKGALIKSWLPLLLGVLGFIATLVAAVSAGLVPYVAFKAPLREPAYDLAIGYLVSLIFYVLVVAIPDRMRRRRTARWLKLHHQNFKRGCIGIYLSTIGDSWDSELPESLLEPKAFRQYFLARHTPNQSRWHAVHNGLYEYGLPQLITECELFAHELEYTLLKLDISDDDIVLFIKRLSRSLRRLKTASPTYDDIKQLLNVLYPLHANWDWGAGYLDEDPIGTRLAKL